MPSRDSEPVVLVCTDIVDSTEVAASLGDARNASLWQEHDARSRALVARWHGEELERTDGIVVQFARPEHALGFALAYTLELETLTPPLRSRIGIHRGPPGRATRAQVDAVTALAGPGHVLVTREARGGRAAELDSRGFWRLLGEGEPVEVFAVRRHGQPSAPLVDRGASHRVVRRGDATWTAVHDLPHTLPAEWDAFVGRDADLAALAEGIRGPRRLLSVIAIGGAGKTRLVTHFAWRHRAEFPGGAWFCDLSEATDRDGVVRAVAMGLDTRLAGADPVEQLGRALAARGRCLVILDNAEQVVAVVAEVVEAWLRRTSEAVFMVTSRAVLGVRGEQALELPALTEDDACALFVTRAVAARRDFSLSEDDVPHVRALVRLLDALPLALELAAARLRVLNVRTLRERMGERFALLRSRGARPRRQATLRGMLDWSWELLEPALQAALARLAVFEGGFSLSAAVAVLDAPEAEAWVESLVERSLVRRVDAVRFDLLVSVQSYASDRLVERGERGVAEARHGAHFAQLGEDAFIASLGVHGGVERRRALVRDADNVLAAVRRAVRREDAEVAVYALRAAAQVLEAQGPLALLHALADKVGALALSDALGLHWHMVKGRIAWRTGDAPWAERQFERVRELARTEGEPHQEALALGSVGAVRLGLAQFDEARARFLEARALHEELGNRRYVGVWEGLSGLAWLHEGRPEVASPQMESALELFREVGDRMEEAVTLGNLGELRAQQGRVDEAHAMFAEALALKREVGDRRSEGVVTTSIADLRAREGDLEGARDLYEAALAMHRETGLRSFEALVLTKLGVLGMIQDAPEDAREAFEQALAIQVETGNRRLEAEVRVHLGTLHREAGRYTEAAQMLQAALGLERDIGNRASEAEVWVALGALREAEGELEAARAALTRALDLYRELGRAHRVAQPLARLGDLDARAGDLASAQRRWEESERLLRDHDQVVELAHHLARRAGLRAAFDPPAAQADLDAAETLAEQLRATPEGTLGRRIAGAKHAIYGPETRVPAPSTAPDD